MNNPILRAENILLKKNERYILNINSFTLYKGAIKTIIGENGAGKTTFLLTLASLITPNSGNVFFNGMKIFSHISAKEYRKKIAIVFQENLLLNDSVFNNVAVGLTFRKFSSSDIKNKVDDILSLLNITHLKNQKAKTLSGGEAKRVCIARALVIDPEILFLDEPFSSLDAVSKEGIIFDLAKIIKERKISTLLVTHDRYEALRLSDSIVVMDSGRIIQEGSKEEIINYPKNTFVASFVGIENILEGVVVKQNNGDFLAKVQDKFIEGTGDFNVNTKLLLCIRPENIFLSLEPKNSMTSVRNFFFGTIKEINDYGHIYRITVDCGFLLVSYITKNSFKQMSLSLNDKIYAGFKATAVHAITSF